MKPIARNSILSVLAVTFLLAGTLRAETIHLKSGQIIEGTVVERTEDSVKVDTGVGILVTYYLDEIESATATPHVETTPPEIIAEPEITHPATAPSAPPPADSPAPTPIAATPAPDPIVPTQALQVTPPPTSISSAITHKIEEKFPLYTTTTTDTSLPPWQAPRLSRDEYLKTQAARARTIEREHINKIILALKGYLTSHWRGLKDAHPLVRTIAESPAGLAIAISLWAGIYVLICYPLMRLSHRFKCGGWMAWVPILQIFQLLRVADKSPIWFLFFLFPVISLLAFVFVGMSIARRLEQPYWLGYFMLVPGVNIFVLWHLALLPDPATSPKRQDGIDTGIKFE